MARQDLVLLRAREACGSASSGSQTFAEVAAVGHHTLP